MWFVPFIIALLSAIHTHHSPCRIFDISPGDGLWGFGFPLKLFIKCCHLWRNNMCDFNGTNNSTMCQHLEYVPCSSSCNCIFVIMLAYILLRLLFLSLHQILLFQLLILSVCRFLIFMVYTALYFQLNLLLDFSLCMGNL